MHQLQHVRNGAVIVAHPDDETIWAGGLIASFPGCWTVIACSIPRTDPIRAWKFFDACEMLGARGRLLPYAEGGPSEPLKNLEQVEFDEFDVVVTHNAKGEYGHEHHKQVHRFVAGKRGEFFTFGYGQAGSICFELSNVAQRQKYAALQCYNHVSTSDGKPKWEALLERYPDAINFDAETFDAHSA